MSAATVVGTLAAARGVPAASSRRAPAARAASSPAAMFHARPGQIRRGLGSTKAPSTTGRGRRLARVRAGKDKDIEAESAAAIGDFDPLGLASESEAVDADAPARDARSENPGDEDEKTGDAEEPAAPDASGSASGEETPSRNETSSEKNTSDAEGKDSDAPNAGSPNPFAKLVPKGVRDWFTSIPANAQARHLDQLYEAADASPGNFVKQDTLMRELYASKRYDDVIKRFEERDFASGPGSVVAYLNSMAKLGKLEQFDVQMPPKSQISMMSVEVMKDKNLRLSGDEAVERVMESVATAAADKSELPIFLRDLSVRSKGKPEVAKLPAGRSAAAPLHVVISDGAGGVARGAGAKAGDNGLVNFLFYCTLGLCAWGGMGAVRQYAGKVSASKGASTSMMTSSQTANRTGGLLPGDAKPSLPAAQKKESSFDPKEYNKEALSEKSVKTFNDVKGCDEAKQELQEIVEYLKNPDLFTRLGGKLPKGVLLSGPPGTGKTLLARAVAGEAGVPFFYRAGSEFEEMFVGVGSKRVRQLFSAAKKKTPCIVFIDEIDAVGTSRKAFETQSRKTLNQLLTEMDGFEQNEGIIVIAATNIPEQLDPALTRPGRFDRLIHVPNPDIGGRREILAHYLSDKPVEADVDVESLARGTSGFSGAELFNLVNMACVQAAVTGETTITSELLDWAKDRIVMGVERKSAVLTEESKRLTAYHEAGHAIVALRTPGAMPVHKATIVPRGSALGMVTQLPDKDETSITRKQLLARLDVCMGGRVAEELIFGKDEVTTGALSDLQQATRLATYMVGEVGLSSLVGPVHVDSMSKGGRRATEALVDKEVVQLLRDSHARVTKLLTKHTADLHTLSAEMLRQETLTGDEIRAVLGMEPAIKPAPPPPKHKPKFAGGDEATLKEAEATNNLGETEKDGEETIDILLPEVVEPVEAIGDKSEAKESEVPA